MAGDVDGVWLEPKDTELRRIVDGLGFKLGGKEVPRSAHPHPLPLLPLLRLGVVRRVEVGLE